MNETISKPLTFGELKVGDEFISFPVDGDDDGHGGYRGYSYVFLKMEFEGSNDNAMKLWNGSRSTVPDGMLVLRVIS